MLNKSLSIFFVNAIHALIIVCFTLGLEYLYGLEEVGKFSFAQGIITPIIFVGFLNLRLQIIKDDGDLEELLPSVRVLISIVFLLIAAIGLFFSRVDYVFPLIIYKLGEAFWFVGVAVFQRKEMHSLVFYRECLAFFLMIFSIFLLGYKALYVVGIIMALSSIKAIFSPLSFKTDRIKLLLRDGVRLGLIGLIETVMVSVLRIWSIDVYGIDGAGIVSIQLLFFLPISIITMSIGHYVLLSSSQTNFKKVFSLIASATLFLLILKLVINQLNILHDYLPLIVLKNSIYHLIIAFPVLIYSSIVTYRVVKENNEGLLLKASLISLIFILLLIRLFNFQLESVVFLVYVGFFLIRLISIKFLMWRSD